MRDKVFSIVCKHPIWVILACITVVAIATTGAKNLVFKNGYDIFFSEENPQLTAFENMQKVYTKSDSVTFIIAPKGGDTFNAEHLSAIKRLTDQSWQVPYSTRVDSITNYQYSYSTGDDLIVENLVRDPSKLTQSDLEKIRGIALNDPLLVHKIISPSGHVSVVNVTVHLPGINPIKEIPEIAASVREIKRKFLEENPENEVYLSGGVMLNASFGEVSRKDSITLIPLMFLVVIVSIGFLLRTISGTIATVLVTLMSIASTMGIVGWLGFYLTGPSSSAPTMILTLAIADCVHILTSMFYEMRQGVDKRQAIIKSLNLNFQPILLTSITTAIGFLSMNFSDSPPFRDLGNMVAIGVMLAFVLSMTIFPALLILLPFKVTVPQSGSKDRMALFADFVVGKRKLLLPLMSALIILMTLFIPNNQLNDNFIKYFDESIPFRTATNYMEENLSGVMYLEISVKTGVPSGINDPKYLQKIEDFSQWLRQQSEIDHVSTITDTLKRLNKNMHGDDQTWYKLPVNKEMSAQYLLLYEMSLPYGLDLNNQLDIDKSSTRITGVVHNMTSNEIIDFEQRINLWFSQHSPEYEIDIASPSLMFAHIGQRNILSLLIGTSLALVLISILLGLALRSWRYGLISLLPNLVPASMAFGFWGLYSGQVGLGLSVVIGMTLGIVVDDTVHFLSKYLHARRERQASSAEAIHYAFDNVGRALWVTSFALIAGFSVLMQSSFQMNADMGALTAITIFTALIIDFLFLPPLLMAIDN